MSGISFLKPNVSLSISHANFFQYVETEKPSFFLSCAEFEDEQDAVYFLEIKNLGVNFADILGMRKTLTTIDCWYVFYSILVELLDSSYLLQVPDNPTKHRGSYAARTYAPRSVEG